MSVTGLIYGQLFLQAFKKTIDLLGTPDTLKTMLCTSSYVPNQDTHVFKSDVTNEVTGTGYTAGGVALTTMVFTYTAGTNVVMLDADDASWAASTITARVAVVYDATPASDATRPLFVYQLSTTDIVSTAGTFTVTWNASGIMTITVA